MAVIAVVLAVAALGVAVVGVGSALAGRQRVIDAADAAALAAADAASGAVGGTPCDLASVLARANEAKLVSCRVEAAVASVTVSARILGIPASASARAGPPIDADHTAGDDGADPPP